MAGWSASCMKFNQFDWLYPCRDANYVLVEEEFFNDKKNYEINSWHGMINRLNDTHNAKCITNTFSLTKIWSRLCSMAYVLFLQWASGTIWQRSSKDSVWESLLTIEEEKKNISADAIRVEMLPRHRNHNNMKG